MRNILMVFGMTMMLGSGLLAFQAKQQINEDPSAPLDIASLLGGLQGQVMNLAQPAPKRDARQANLPQIDSRKAAKMSTNYLGEAASEVMDDLNNKEMMDGIKAAMPQLQMLIRDDEETARKGFWASIREKATPQYDGARLKNIQKRNAQIDGSTFSMGDIANMSQGEIMRNMGAIQKSLMIQGTRDIGLMKMP